MKLLSRVCLALMVCFSLSFSARAGFLPYGRIFKATKDERAYTTQAYDLRLQLKLQRILFMDDFASLIDVNCYVYLGHGFLVGEVDDEVQRNSLLECAQAVTGLNGVSYYLPVKKEVPDSGDSALEMRLKGILEPDYPSTQISLRVVQNTVVVIGVLSQNEQEKALAAVKKISGNDQIINFLAAPAPEESKIIRLRPLKRLFK